MGVQTVTETVLVATLVTSVAYFGFYAFRKWKKIKIPSKWEKVGTVKKICLYPLKSGNRIELTRARCTEVGLQQSKEDEKAFQLRDRELIVYGETDYEFRTARTYPKMVLIDVSVHDENHFAIDAPTMRTLYVKIPRRNEVKEVNIKCWYNERINGLDCGDEAASWLSRYLVGREFALRLAYNDGNRARDITSSHQKLLEYYKNLSNQACGLFSDLASIHLVSQASVNDMNNRIDASSITPLNFRPNIIVHNPTLKPYDEDTWDFVKIGDDIILRVVKEGTRCILTTVNPENGIKDAKMEPLTTLDKYRRSKGPEKTGLMGVYLEVRSTGFLKIGDPVFISRAEEASTAE